MSRLGAVVLLVAIVALAASLAVLRTMDRGRGNWSDALGDRFYLGVPWGTLVVVAFVLAVYLFVQDGRTDWSNPVTIPYRAWSYWYPLGLATASFSHNGPNHLLGNLAGTLVLAPIAEYFWGHRPREPERVRHARLADPRIRAFVVFPTAVIGIGLLTSVFALGPVIGFSGVVFAFAGFAIVRYPIATIVAILGAHGAILTVIRAVQSPILWATAQPSPPAPPSWATIAIQGHAIGFLFGVLLGATLLRRRRVRPDPVLLWLAILLFGFAQSLWAIYWFAGEGTFVLLRGPGVIVVVSLAIVVTVAIVGSDRSLVPGRLRRGSAADETVERRIELGFGSSGSSDRSRPRVERLSRSVASGADGERFTSRGAALLAVLLVVAAISGPAVAVNAFVVDSGDAEGAVAVADYEVAYDEGVENPLVSIAPVDALGLNETVTASGVIVWSEDRGIWTDAVTADRLAFTGEEEIHLGGPGWRETVTAERAGWDVVGNESAYAVRLSTEGDGSTLAFESDAVTSDVVIVGNRISIVPKSGEFQIELREENGSATTVPIPEEGDDATVADVTFVREDDELYAESGGTRVVVASAEEYQ
ncbi:rhomboid family intramembrane serine protease [Halovivax sp.]|uniref:rhomboid family intramembrane serine protease n=1 Tax=Halovivax sp. TaxID=1935978 RepID=UPI0025BE4D99|nr:rhomboid family intramembrane serine protease [Halovivax sp.]